MFKRVSFEAWHDFVPVIAFVLTFGVFIYFVVRALRIKRRKAEYLANLPLDETGTHPGDQGDHHE